MVGTTGETGIDSGPLAVRSGETYVGSLFARGTAPDGLVVRLQDGTTHAGVGRRCRRPVSSGVNTRSACRSTPRSQAARLQVVMPGRGDVLIDQVSLMPQSWRDAGGYRPDLLEAVAQLRPPVIRWPGGCFASPYRWKYAIGPQAKRQDLSALDLGRSGRQLVRRGRVRRGCARGSAPSR